MERVLEPEEHLRDLVLDRPDEPALAGVGRVSKDFGAIALAFVERKQDQRRAVGLGGEASNHARMERQSSSSCGQSSSRGSAGATARRSPCADGPVADEPACAWR